ncbi:hypothetical protein N7451_000260 [Penicillium sp. IBT 35674x]|nr:hypothetical protein N7451_000260 [Penicillium sp. IBT 35674x]
MAFTSPIHVAWSTPEYLEERCSKHSAVGRELPPGRLDIILEQSRRLKTNVVETLKEIGEILICNSSRYDESIVDPQVEGSFIQNHKQELERLLDNAAMFLSAEERSNSSSDEDTSDDSSSTAESELNRFGRLHSLVVCLMDLVPAIERHVFCLQQRVPQLSTPLPNMFHLSHGARPFAVLISDRFASAPTSLVERLAEANWERSVRIRKQVEEKAEEGKGLSFEGDLANEDAMTWFKPYSIFHDSGIGTSVFTGSQYAATSVSHKSFLSTVEEQGQGRPRVPHLPHERGQPFKCEYCQKVITMRDRIGWKMHVFADLQSYLCTHADCKDALRTFTSRETWARHEINEHFSQLQWRCYECKITTITQEDFVKHLNLVHGIALPGHPLKATILSEAEETVLKSDFKNHECLLCFQTDWKSTKEYATHVGQHLEEISLACLPMDQDCDSDVDLQVDTSSDATKSSLPPVRSTTSNNHALPLTALPDLDDFDILEEQNEGQDNGFSGSQICEVPRNRQRPTTGQNVQPMFTESIRSGQHYDFSPESRAALSKELENEMARVKKKPFQCIKCDVEFSTVGALHRHIVDQHYPSISISCPEQGCAEVFRRRDKARDHCLLKHQRKPSNEELALYTQPIACPAICFTCSKAIRDWKSFYKCFISHCSISDFSQDDETAFENGGSDSGGDSFFAH